MARPARVLLSSFCVLLGVAACRSEPRQSGRLIETVEAPEFTERDARAQLFGFVRIFAGEVERAADAIGAGAGEDAELVERALIWKTCAVSTCLGAATDPDPLVGLLDVSVLVTQMRAYLESGTGSDRFGPQQDIALATARAIEADLSALLDALVGPEQAAQTWEKVRAWTAKHPLRDHRFTRDSATALLRQLTTSAGGSVWSVLGGAEETIEDLTERLSLLTELMPRAMRWQAELVLHRVIREVSARGTLEDVRLLAVRVTAAMDDLEPVLRGERQLTVEAGLTDRAVAQVDAQVGIAMADLRAEREILLQAVDRERNKLTETIRTEREVILLEIDRQRIGTLEAITAERLAILESLESQVEAALARVDQLAARRVTDATRDAFDLVERTLYDGFLYVLGLIGAALAGTCVIVVLARRRRPA